MIDEKYFNQRNLLILAIFISATYYVFLIPVSHLEFQQYDAYYYQSLSQALILEGRLQDYTTIPAREILTPQNGIVFLYVVLEQIGISDKVAQLRIIAFLNGFLIILSTIYLFRIIKLFNLSDTIAFLLALTFPLSFFYQSILLLQKNDCIFITLSLITIYKLLQQDKSSDSLSSLIVLSVAMSMFRIAGVLIFISSFLTFLIQKQFRKALVSLGLIFISLLTLYLTLLLFDIDISRMQQHSRESTSLYSWGFVYHQIGKTLTLSIPESILRFTYYTTNIPISSKLVGIIISILFVILLVINIKNTVSGKVQNKTGVIFLVLYILANLAFFQLYKAQPTRYLLTISPLIPILLFTMPGLRQSHTMGIFFVIITTTISLVGVLNSDKFDMARKKYVYWQNYATAKELENMQLITYFPRVSYFLLNKRSLRDIPDEITVPEDGLVIVGPNFYINSIANKIKGLNNADYNLRILTVTYHGYIGDEMGPHYFPFKKMNIKTVIIKPNVNNK